MMQNRKNYLNEMLNDRGNVIRFISITILLSFGLNVIAGSITLTSGFNAQTGFWLGGAVLLLVLCYLIRIVFKSLRKFITIDSFIIHDKNENSLLDIDRYKFSRKINEYLVSAISEDKDIKAIWDREPIGCYHTVDDWIHGRISKSKIVIEELVEYFIIEELSAHLTDYFNDDKYNEKKLQKIGRNEVPEVLFQNRFLNLFSKPMEERASFEINKNKVEEPPKEYIVNGKKVVLKVGETVSAYGKDGARFNRFDLVLPRNSKVKRIDKNTIRLITDRFDIDIFVRFEEENYYPPDGFIEHYLCPGIDRTDSFFRHEGYKINIELRIKFKILKFLVNGKWEFFYWLDSYLDKINKDMSADLYFERINWESTYTILETIKKNKD
ncbi:hypothetical protein B2I21_11005 [Chryseobacterium mucoviscidosis]|nr:hypothetical protein B2I21_11005 [Chryseobacterium mucoviscidosis]